MSAARTADREEGVRGTSGGAASIRPGCAPNGIKSVVVFDATGEQPDRSAAPTQTATEASGPCSTPLDNCRIAPPRVPPSAGPQRRAARVASRPQRVVEPRGAGCALDDGRRWPRYSCPWWWRRAPAGAAPDPPNACKIERPDGLWPPYFYEDYWNTYTHGGFNSDWVAHPRPVGTVKAVVLFVDFPNAQASDVTQVSPIDYRQPQPYWEFLKASVPWFSTASYGRFNLEVTPIYKWYRMPKDSTQWRMDYRSNDPARRLSADGQGEFTAAAVAAADADVDFSQYDLIYTVPARNQTAIASSPELNNYAHQIVADGNDLGNGDNFGVGHVELGLQAPQPRDRPRGQPHRGLQRGHGRHVPLHGPVGHDGQHLRQRAGLRRLEQVEAGLAQRRRGRLRRLRRGHRAHADAPTRSPPDGASKKLVAIRTGQHTTLVAELRAPLGVDSIAGGNTARYCESGGILLYTVDSTLRNGLGVYKVLDAMPGSTGWGCSDETSISTMGRGQMRGPSHFEVPELGRDVRPDRHQRRRHAGEAEGHPPGHEDRRRARGGHRRPSPPR